MNRLKRWFGFRLAFLVVASAIVYCAVPFVVANMPFLDAKLEFEYTWLSVSVAWTVGLASMFLQYKNVPEQTVMPASPTGPKTVSSKEFDFGMLEDNPGSHPDSENVEKPVGSLIREVSTRKLHEAKPLEPVSFDDVVDNKILRSLDNADVKIDVTVERQGAGKKKWKITKAKAKVKTRRTMQGKPPKRDERPWISKKG